jgi:hypothetical protein
MASDVAISTSNFRLLYIARDAADVTHPSASPTVALLFSAFWLEAFVNDLLDSLTWHAGCGDKLPRRLATLAAVASELEEQRAQLPAKIHIISAVLLGRSFDRSANPYQDFDLLLAIRHRLVHSRPSLIYRGAEENSFLYKDAPKKLRKGLIDRGILDRDDAKFSWDVALHRPALGEWALWTANEMSRAIADCFPRGQWRRWAHEFNPLSPEHALMKRRLIRVG